MPSLGAGLIGANGRRVALLGAIGAACAFVAAPTGALSPVQTARAADRYTPLVQSVMSTPRWFKDSAGRFHVTYELELTNGFPVPVTVTSVTVRDVGRRRTIRRLTGSKLTASMTLLASPGEPATTVPGSGWESCGLMSCCPAGGRCRGRSRTR